MTVADMDTLQQALSLDALRHAAKFPRPTFADTRRRLYLFNKQPSNPHLLIQFPTQRAIYRYLFDDAVNSIITEHWQPMTTSSYYDGWRIYTSRTRIGTVADSRLFKLYVSTEIGDLPSALIRSLKCATGVARSFKIARELHYLLRPDKLIFYFTSRDALMTTAQCLRPEIDPLQAHGLPFSASVDSSAALSWGVDPAEATDPAERSFRGLLTSALAKGMQAAEAPASRIAHGLAYARQVGFDTETWTVTD